VYERSGNWFRIEIPRGSAWIERPDASGFLSYPEQLSGESFLTYLRPEWDGKVWTNPGVGQAVLAPAAWRALVKEQIPIRVTSTQVVRGEKWIHVSFEAESCGQSFGNLPPLEAGYRPIDRLARHRYGFTLAAANDWQDALPLQVQSICCRARVSANLNRL
jgi:hypothetical protein